MFKFYVGVECNGEFAKLEGHSAVAMQSQKPLEHQAVPFSHRWNIFLVRRELFSNLIKCMSHKTTYVSNCRLFPCVRMCMCALVCPKKIPEADFSSLVIFFIYSPPYYCLRQHLSLGLLFVDLTDWLASRTERFICTCLCHRETTWKLLTSYCYRLSIIKLLLQTCELQLEISVLLTT